MPATLDCLNVGVTGYIDNLSVGSNTLLLPANLYTRGPLGSVQQTGTCSTSSARVFSAMAAGVLQVVNISLDTACTSSDSVVIDVLKSTGGGAYASVLTSTYTMNSGKTAKTVYGASITSSSFVAGDIFKVTWTVTGSSGADLLVCLHGDTRPS